MLLQLLNLPLHLLLQLNIIKLVHDIKLLLRRATTAFFRNHA
jgi:hypothetical protein